MVTPGDSSSVHSEACRFVICRRFFRGNVTAGRQGRLPQPLAICGAHDHLKLWIIPHELTLSQNPMSVASPREVSLQAGGSASCRDARITTHQACCFSPRRAPRRLRLAGPMPGNSAVPAARLRPLHRVFSRPCHRRLPRSWKSCCDCNFYNRPAAGSVVKITKPACRLSSWQNFQRLPQESSDRKALL